MEEKVEEEVVVDENQNNDFLSMSDEEFDKMVGEGELHIPEEVVEDEEKETDESVEVTEETSEEAEEVPEEAEENEEIDYKARYEDLASPFKANGKDMQVDSVEDMRHLMQMGANYNKKMAGLKPNLKLLKMLENNGMLDLEKLEYLIDLDKKNPEAITRAVKESGIDPLDIDTEAESSYVPNKYEVDDSQLELDDVLDSIRETPSFQDTIDTVTNKWDDASKKVILAQPSVLKVINDHKTTGIYDQIMTKVSSEKVLGRLNGLSDIEAYKQVGDAIQAQGGFDELIQVGNSTDSKDTNETEPKQEADTQVTKNRKLSARSSKGGVSKKAVKDQNFNPLALSDEEFDKLINSNYV